MPIGKDQETAVIAHQVQAIILMAEVPTDPAVTCRTFPGRGGKAQKSNPVIVIGGSIPKGFADLGQRTQVMMLLHLFLVMGLFEGTNRPDNDFLHIQGNQPPDEVDEMQYSVFNTSSWGVCSGLNATNRHNEIYRGGQFHPAGILWEVDIFRNLF
jgi:hypothetical protein